MPNNTIPEELSTLDLTWHLDDAIVLIRQIEQIAIQNGYHVALGGSVLHAGVSKKDLDILVYPHKSTQHCDIEKFKYQLTTLNIKSNWQEVDHTHYGDSKEVLYTFCNNGKRIDFFFLE